MAKRKRDRRPTEGPAPTAINVDFPVYVPNADGTTQIEIGRARLRYGTLVVEFKDSGPAEAIQNMIARGVVLGFATVMVKPDVVNEMYQEVVNNDDAVADAIAKGVNGGLLRFNAEGKLEAVAGDQTPEEIIQVLLNLDQIVVEKPVESNEFVIEADPNELSVIFNNHEENKDG